MGAAFVWLVALAAALACVGCDGVTTDDSMSEEPQTYTVSFFQFDPKQLLNADDVKRTSKKEIKDSDLVKKSKNQHARNNTGLKRNMNPLDPNPKPSEEEAARSLPHPAPLNDTTHDHARGKNRTETLDMFVTSSQVKKEDFKSSVAAHAIGNSTAARRKLHLKATPSALANVTHEAAVLKKSGEDESNAVHEAAHETHPNPNKTAILSKLKLKSNETKKFLSYANNETKNTSAKVVRPPFAMVAKSQVPNKLAQENAPTQSKLESETLLHHRQLVAQFVPVYRVSPKDHGLTYQRGSIKHPKHSLYPQCHVCPSNSTYAQCVKHSTLMKCDNGLSNICYTKSHKSQDVISYEMGCADHAMCVGAKAFPCKDGSKSCFTCCQWDRCNSSPHHGNYELDELRLDQLQGSTPSLGQSSNFCSILGVVFNLVVFLLLH